MSEIMTINNAQIRSQTMQFENVGRDLADCTALLCKVCSIAFTILISSLCFGLIAGTAGIVLGSIVLASGIILTIQSCYSSKVGDTSQNSATLSGSRLQMMSGPRHRVGGDDGTQNAPPHQPGPRHPVGGGRPIPGRPPGPIPGARPPHQPGPRHPVGDGGPIPGRPPGPVPGARPPHQPGPRHPVGGGNPAPMPQRLPVRPPPPNGWCCYDYC